MCPPPLCRERGLPRTEPLYVRIPGNWPAAVTAWLAAQLGPKCRHAIVKVVKGSFGLAESLRMWSQKFSNVLKELGFQESRIIKCLFIKFKNVAGRVVAQTLVALHVGDAMLSGDDTCVPLSEALKSKFAFGEWENLRDKPTEVCGRFLHRGSDMEVESDIDFEAQTVHGLKLDA